MRHVLSENCVTVTHPSTPRCQKQTKVGINSYPYEHSTRPPRSGQSCRGPSLQLGIPSYESLEIANVNTQ